MIKKFDFVNIAFALVLTITIGFSIGYTLGMYQARANFFPDIQSVSEINPGIATVQMLEVRSGEIIGKVTGRNARLAYSPDAILELQEGAYFRIPIDQIDLSGYYQAEAIPEDVNFIASVQGEYYYHLLDKRAFGIIPENRMYFSTDQEAETAGYKKAE